jgi:cytochrome c
MKNVIIGSMLVLGLSASAFAADGKTLTTKCVACHGTSFEKVALGKAAIVKGQKAETIETSLKGYKAGTLNKNGMGALMKGQVASLSESDIKVVAKYISEIK